jgi:hypothetical protein
MLLPETCRRWHYGMLASGSSLLSTVARSARRVIATARFETLCQPERGVAVLGARIRIR